MNTKIIKLDINRRLYDKIVAKQDDTGSRFLLFQLLDGAVPFNLTDRSVRVYGVKPDGAVIFNDLTVTHSATGFCLLELTNQMLAITGTVKLELMITEGDKKLTSIPFEMEVIKKINSNDAVESSNEFRALLNALKEIDDWNKEFADKSGKLEELYTPRLNELGSHLETNKNEEKAINYFSSTVFKQYEDFQSNYFRIPFMCVTKNGVIVAGSDVRYKNGNDESFIELGIARSLDYVKTWQDKKIAMQNNNVDSNYSRVMDGTILYDEEKNRIYLLGNYWNTGTTGWTQSNTHKEPDWDIKICYSDDEGLNWSEPVSLRELCPTGVTQFIGGVGSGIKMENGTLVFPIQLAKVDDSPYNVQSGIMSSADGINWSISESYVPAYTSECNVFEYRGELYINCRQEGSDTRAIYKTSNLGVTWEFCDMSLNTPQPNPCMGSTIKLNTDDNLSDLILYSCVNSTVRGNLTLKVLNFNDTAFNNVVTYYNSRCNGYSCISYDKKNKKLYSVFETQGDIKFIDLTPSLQYCYNEKSKEIEYGKLKSTISINISDNSILTLNDLPHIINGKYKKAIIKLKDFTGDFYLSNIQAQVEITCDDGFVELRKPYIRNCLSVRFMTETKVLNPFSSEYVFALENTNMFFASGRKLIINEDVNSQTLFYQSNSNINVGELHMLHPTKVINTYVAPREGGGNVTIATKVLPPGEMTFIKNIDASICNIYIKDDGENKSLRTGNNNVIEATSGGLIVPYNINYNGIINGITSLSSRISIVGSGDISSLLLNSTVICHDWRFRTNEEVPSSSILFILPKALRPKTDKYISGVGFLNGVNETGICLKVESSGNVVTYGIIPNNMEVVITGGYTLF